MENKKLTNGKFIKVNKNNVLADFNKNIQIKLTNELTFWISKKSVVSNSPFMNELTIVINPDWDYYLNKTKTVKGSTIIEMIGV